MRSAYRVLAYLIAIAVALQAAFIALSSFGVIHDVDSGKVIDKDFEPNIGGMLHGIGGMYVIPVLALALLVVSFFAKVSGGVKWALFVLLAVALQIVFAFVAFGLPGIGVLHGLNAFAILGLSLTAAMRTRNQVATPAAPTVDHVAA